MSNEAYKAMQDHIKIMWAKLNELKKKRKSRKHMSSGAVLHLHCLPLHQLLMPLPKKVVVLIVLIAYMCK
jgi:hypothetical protein